MVCSAGFPQGCPPGSCFPGAQVLGAIVKTEGNQAEVATLLCSNSHTWGHKSPQELGCGPRSHTGTNFRAGSLPPTEGHDVHLQHMGHSAVLLFISTFLYTYIYSEATSTTLQCKWTLSYLWAGGLQPKMAKTSQVSSLLSVHCIPSSTPVFPVQHQCSQCMDV